MKRLSILLVICLGLFVACATRTTWSSTGPYLGYDEDLTFRVDEDEGFSANRPEYLMKYWTLSEVKIADEAALGVPIEKRLFVVEKEGYLYFSLAYSYEHYVWGPSPQDPDLITTTGKYWVSGLDRYKTTLTGSQRRRPTQRPDSALGKSPVPNQSPPPRVAHH